MNALDLAESFPLMRGGGAFLVAIGLGIAVGALGSRKWRLVWLIIGAGVGVLVMAIGGATKIIFAGLPYPPIWQWVVLGLAYLAEVLLINVLLRKVPDTASRPFWLWILFIVGAHFLILGFSHGPISAVIAVLCMVNALIGLRVTAVDLRVFWAVDGAIKIAGGATMVALSYA